MIADSSVLIAFARSGRLALLQDVVGPVTVPDAVWEEVTGDPRMPGASAIRDCAWIVRRPVTSQGLIALPLGLGPGETEAIRLALELGIGLLVDDLRARAAAKSLGIRISGSVGVALSAKALGLVPDVATLLTQLREAGLRIGNRLYEQALAQAGEVGT